MEEIVKYDSIKQNLIDEMPKFYSDIELRKLGRLLGIADYDFVAKGATKAEICESLIMIIFQRELVERLIQILNEDGNLKRNAMLKIVNFNKSMVVTEECMYNDLNHKTILHISDIHFSKKEDVNRWLLQLSVDLKINLNTSVIDYMVISGDITNIASGEEFEYALSFIQELIKEFKLQREKIIIVPGNHDYNRNTTIAAMEAEKIINNKLYLEKFDSFQRFHVNATGKCYSECIEQQGIINVYDADKLLVLGLNSSWNIDHINKYKASINMDALYEVAKKILAGQYKDYFKIAVFHHPIAGLEQMNSEFMELLAQMGFRICMHGHIHEAKDEYFNYDDKRKIRIIGAGTFGALTKEQVPGIPHQYNLIRWYSDSLEVHTRKKEKPDGGWKADARWCDNENPKSYYTIELTNCCDDMVQKKNVQIPVISSNEEIIKYDITAIKNKLQDSFDIRKSTIINDYLVEIKQLNDTFDKDNVKDLLFNLENYVNKIDQYIIKSNYKKFLEQLTLYPSEITKGGVYTYLSYADKNMVFRFIDFYPVSNSFAIDCLKNLSYSKTLWNGYSDILHYYLNRNENMWLIFKVFSNNELLMEQEYTIFFNKILGYENLLIDLLYCVDDETINIFKEKGLSDILSKKVSGVSVSDFYVANRNEDLIKCAVKYCEVDEYLYQCVFYLVKKRNTGTTLRDGIDRLLLDNGIKDRYINYEVENNTKEFSSYMGW